MLRDKLKNSRLIVFAHFDRDDRVDPHVLFYLAALKKLGGHLVFVSTARLSPIELKKLGSLVNEIVIKENVGYDFGSWQHVVLRKNLLDFSELILCNDSCYGPLFDLNTMFSAMEGQDCDFWGPTANREVAFHIQSYFLVFRSKVLHNPVFIDFWSTISAQERKISYIVNYEVGLSQFLIRNGFKAGSVFHFRFSTLHLWFCFGLSELVGYFLGTLARLFDPWINSGPFRGFKKRRRNLKSIFFCNPTHKLWHLLLKSQVPFIKVELLRDNPLKVNLRKLNPALAKLTNYDLKLIRDHLDRIKKLNPSKAS